MRETTLGTMTLSSWSFRLTGTVLILMLPIFVIGRVLDLSQSFANASLGTLAAAAASAAIVGSIARIWGR